MLACAALIGSLWLVPDPDQDPELDDENSHQKTFPSTRLPRIPFPASLILPPVLSRHNHTPILFTGAASVLPLPAYSTWPSDDHVSKSLGASLLGVYEAKDPVFLYWNDGKPLSYMLDKPVYRDVAISGKELVGLINGSNESYYVYYSGKIGATPAMAKEVEGLGRVRVCEKESGRNVNLWAGGRGVTARGHYDSFHNAYFQISGRKRFVLLPPEAQDRVFLHPKAHPSYRQSQLEDFEAATANFTGKIDVTLGPGDVLYIPPFWFHHVVAVERSLSVNIWCDSDEYNVMEEALILPVPLEEGWEKAKILAGSLIFLRGLVGRVLFPNRAVSDPGLAVQVDAFFSSLYDQRFSPLLPKYAGEPIGDLERLCGKDKAIKQARFTFDYAKMGSRTERIRELYRRVSRPIQMIHLGNLVEDLVGHFFGHHAVPFYLKHCINI